jgi:hypothetical protein
MPTKIDDPPVADRRVAAIPSIGDRRLGLPDRRLYYRMSTLKGGQIFWRAGSSIKCIVRNLSETGAALQVDGLVPNSFELVLDADGSRRSCVVVWRRRTRVGVNFR